MFSPLGFGGGPLGGLFAPLDDETAAGALAAAWEGGVRYFDTAPHYGIGHSERRIGAFLRGRPPGEFTVSTKVGRLLVPQDPAGREDEAFAVPATHRRVWDFSRDGVRRSLEEAAMAFPRGLRRWPGSWWGCARPARCATMWRHSPRRYRPPSGPTSAPRP